ncbi:MAG: tetratricopeptide repeat protein [Steroidobacteraceae bacterium]
MTTFIAICALLTAVAIALLVWPLLRPAKAGSEVTPRSGIAAIVVGGAMPLAAFAIYFLATTWSWDPARHGETAAAGDLQQMVAQLQARLANQPDDVEGWKLLGRSATVMGDYVLARDAFGRANEQTQGKDPEALVGFAESLVLNDEREIDGRAADMFEQALAMEPDSARALWYGGIVAYRRGDLPLAQQRWVELQNHDLPPDLRQAVAERLAEIDKAQGKTPAVATAAPAAPAAPATSSIELNIDIASSLAGKVPQGATLFVIARRGEGGPPLAVVRRTAGAWPQRVSMTDANAMLPGVSLASGGALKVIARVSSSGQPVAVSGDLFGEVGYDFTSADPATITIDRIVP